MPLIEGDPPAHLLPLITHPPGIETAEEFLKRCAWVVNPAFRSKFGALYLDQLDSPDGRDHRWLVSGWLSEGDKSAIAGASKAGKSFLAIEIALDVALGRGLFGNRVKQGGVIYAAGEGAPGVKKRLRAYAQHHALEFSHNIPFVLLQKPVAFYRAEESLKDLIAEVRAHARAFNCPLRLVVVDTLAKASIGAEENSVKDMGLVLAAVDTLQAETQAHVMLVHHMDAKGEKLRGSTSIYATVDQVLYVTRDESTKIRTVRLDKQKDDEEGTTFRFELPQVILGKDEDGRDVTSCVCVPVGEKESVRREEERKGLRLSVSAEVFMRAYFAAEDRYGYPVPQEINVPAGVRAIVPWNDIKRLYGELSPDDAPVKPRATEEDERRAKEKHQDALKTRLTRLREEMIAQGVLGYGAEGGVAVAWHTGAALRAFPRTQKREPPDDPALAIPF